MTYQTLQLNFRMPHIKKTLTPIQIHDNKLMLNTNMTNILNMKEGISFHTTTIHIATTTETQNPQTLNHINTVDSLTNIIGKTQTCNHTKLKAKTVRKKKNKL